MTSLFWMVLKLTALLFWKVSYWRIFCESYILSTQRQNIDQFFPCSFLQRAWGNIKANQWIYWIYIYQPRGTSILLKKKKKSILIVPTCEERYFDRMQGRTHLWRLRPLPADWYQDVVCGGSRGGGGGAASDFCGPAPHVLACSPLQFIVTTSYHGCLQCGHTKKAHTIWQWYRLHSSSH